MPHFTFSYFFLHHLTFCISECSEGSGFFRSLPSFPHQRAGNLWVLELSTRSHIEEIYYYSIKFQTSAIDLLNILCGTAATSQLHHHICQVHSFVRGRCCCHMIVTAELDNDIDTDTMWKQTVQLN